MLIPSLIEQYNVLLKAGKVPEAGWSNLTGAVLVADINKDGELVDVSLQDRADSGALTLVPFQPGHGNGGNDPFFMCDTMAFVFGVQDKPKKKHKKYEHSSELHTRLLRTAKSAGLKALDKFFKLPPVTAEHPVLVKFYEDHPEIKKDSKYSYWVQFSCRGELLTRHPEVVKIWNAEYSNIVKAYPRMCAIDKKGAAAHVPATHPKIRGTGCAGTGSVLVGFNQSSAESYGKEQGMNAPMSAEGAFKYTAALSYLLRFKGNNFRLGSAVGVYWSGAMMLDELNYLLGFSSLDPEEKGDLADTVHSIQRGKLPKSYKYIKGRPFTLCVLQPNSSRLAVKSLHTAELDTVVENITKWYAEAGLSPFRFLSKLSATDKYKDIPAPHIRSLLNYVLLGHPVNNFLLTGVVKKYKILTVTGAYNNLGGFINLMIKERRYLMDEQAFNCGKLFQLYEYIQWKSNRQNSVSRMFTASCESPGSTLTQLYKKMKSVYVPRLERGAGIWAAKKLEELVRDVDLPTLVGVRFNVSQQASFIAGYEASKQKTKEVDDETTAEQV